MSDRAHIDPISAGRAEHHAARRADRRSGGHPEDVGGPPRVSGTGAAGGRASPLWRARRRAGASRRARATGGTVALSGDRSGPGGRYAVGSVDLRWARAAPTRPAADDALKDRAAGAIPSDRGRASGGCARGSARLELSDRPVLPSIRAALARARA